MKKSKVGLSIENITTPAVIIDREKVERNCKRMIDVSQDLNITLRVHTKTHKTIEAVDIQTDGRRRCLVCSTLAECQFYADHGCDDILYGFPLGIHHMERVAKLAGQLSQFHVLIASPDMSKYLAETPPPETKTWSVFIKISCGYMRAGIWWEDVDAVESVAKKLINSPNTCFKGLYVHCGNTYNGKNVKKTSDETIDRLLQLVDSLRHRGVNCPVFGVGSTPSCSNPGELMAKVSEIHPGNYVFYDVQQVSIGSCSVDDIAISVATRIVGHNHKAKTLLVDCGFIALTKQGYGEEIMNSGHAVIKNEPNLRLKSMTQEIGQIEAVNGTLDFNQYPIGMILFLLPWHACATAAQHISYLVVKNGIVVEEWETVKGW